MIKISFSSSICPVIDLYEFENSTADDKRKIGQKVDEACCEVGFLTICNHGIAQSILDNAWQAGTKFFDLPNEEKQKSSAPYSGYPYGYIGPEHESLARSTGDATPPDLKESFNIGPEHAPEGEANPDTLNFVFAPSI